MPTQRFFIAFDTEQSIITIRDMDFISQVTRVLRMRKGDECFLINKEGIEARVSLTAIADKALTFEVVETEKVTTEPKRQVVLYCAILKKENFEWVAQKATEAGVTQLIPIITRRTVKLDVKLERVQKILKEAAEQSGRGIIPSTRNPMTFEEAVADTQKNSLTIAFDIQGEPFDSTSIQEHDSIGIFIGPEGGWEEAELDALETINASLTTLGPRTLRAETAAIIATFLAAQE